MCALCMHVCLHSAAIIADISAPCLVQTEYMYVPTTVFTPLEYGACGLPEEDARAIYGDGNIDVSSLIYELVTLPNFTAHVSVAWGLMSPLLPCEEWRIAG